MRFEMSGKGGMRPDRGADVRQEEPLRHEADEPCRVVMAGEAADGVAAMSLFGLVRECAGRGRLRQAEPCCGRGCRDEPVWAGVGMRRPEAVVAGGAVLRMGLPCGYGWRSRVVVTGGTCPNRVAGALERRGVPRTGGTSARAKPTGGSAWACAD